MAKRKFSLTDNDKDKIIDVKTGKNMNETDLPIICEKIKFYRELRRMEQKELATNIGITANAISNWERGRTRPDVNLLPAICDTLQITLYELFGLDEPFDITAEEQTMIDIYRPLTQSHKYFVRRMIESLNLMEISENSDFSTVYKGKALTQKAEKDEASGLVVYVSVDDVKAPAAKEDIFWMNNMFVRARVFKDADGTKETREYSRWNCY